MMETREYESNHISMSSSKYPHRRGRKDAKTDGRDWRSADALAHYETVCALWIQ